MVFMKYHLISMGCSMNKGESEFMNGVLESKGHKEVSAEQADLIIINSCFVKRETEQKVERLIKQFENKKVLLTGCLAQASPYKFADVSVMGLNQISSISEVAEKAFASKVFEVNTQRSNPLMLNKKRYNKIINITPISTGCLGSCSYCCVRTARRSLNSYPADTIVNHIKQSLNDGVKEVWLTSQDCGAYGKDIDSSLPSLLKKVLSIKGEFKVRLGMMNPKHVKDFLPELIEALKHPKTFRFVHLPVQSGSDRVLGLMNRGYTSRTFVQIIKKIKNEIRDVTVSTDVITGFPGENYEDFNKTLNLLKEITPDVLNTSRFWPRPGTPLERSRINGAVSKKRSRSITRFFEEASLKKNEELIGSQVEVLIDEQGKAGTMIGRSDNYKPVIVKGRLGERVKASIVSATPHYLNAVN